MIEHTKQYSPYGIGFNKKFIFVAGGAPVYYVRADYFNHQNWSDYALTFVTPFWPHYAAKREQRELGFKICDYTHEREWRVPHDLEFEYSDIEFIVLKNYEDMAKLLRIPASEFLVEAENLLKAINENDGAFAL